MVTIAYIASLGHSGSTLLDLMLAAHSRVFSVGEIKSLRRFTGLAKGQPKHEFHANRLGNRCACGAETIWQCDFWSNVDRILQARDGRTLADLDIGSPVQEVFSADNRALFEAVAAASGADVVVDSSKEPGRLRKLRQTPGLDLKPIHLLRRPQGQINSAFRSFPPLTLLRAARSYNAVTVRIHAALLGMPRAIVHYEDLVTDPIATLEPLMRYVGLKPEPGQLDWARPVHHNLGGNGKVLLATQSTLRPDETWRQRFGLAGQLQVDLLTAPAQLTNLLFQRLHFRRESGIA
jgi:hypothetical protein